MLGVDGVGDRPSWAILARNFSVENWERQEERKRAYKKRRKRTYKKEERWHPNSRAQPPRSGDCDRSWTSFLRKRERGRLPGQHLLNRVDPTCTERQSLNKECGWKGGDRSGLAEGQELTERKKKNKNILTRKKNRKTHLTHTGLLMEGLVEGLSFFSMRSPAVRWESAYGVHDCKEGLSFSIIFTSSATDCACIFSIARLR
jgi:hypothetical protein